METTITLLINGQSTTLTIDEAKRLLKNLKEIFEVENIFKKDLEKLRDYLKKPEKEPIWPIVNPYYPPENPRNPYPYYPRYPWSPYEITC